MWGPVVGRSSRRRVRLLTFVLLVCVPSLLLSAAAPRHAAAAGPTAIATPNTNIGDGQWVSVSVTGDAPGTSIGFRECVAGATNVATGCTHLFSRMYATTDATGAATTYVPVYANADPLLGNSGNTAAIVCDSGHACVIAATADNSDLVGAAFAPLSFAPSTTDCPSPGPSAVFGTGAATAYRAVYRWQATTCVAPYSIGTIYGLSNSFDGVSTFGLGQDQANFAVTGPVPPFTLPPSAPTYKMAPITSSALVLGYRIFDRRGTQITNLTLTPWLISQIFEGQVSLSSNPDIAFLNPGVQFPSEILPVARAEHSAETYVFTSWLSATLGKGSWPSGTQSIFPNTFSGVQHTSGSRGVAAAVQDPITAYVGSATGLIGFMDSSTAAYYGLPTVNIKMPSGTTISPTPAAIAKGLSLATQNADGTWTPDYTPSDPTAYPMSYPSYLVAPTNQISGDQGKTLAAFLKYAVQQGQTGLPAGYVPLPTYMVNQSLAVADAIPQVSTPSAAGGTSGPGASSPAFSNTSLNNDSGIPNGDLGPGGPGATAASTRAGGKPKATPSGPPIPAMALSGSLGRWMLLGVAALAAFGVVAGPVTLLVARPWPPPWLRRLRRALHVRPRGVWSS